MVHILDNMAEKALLSCQETNFKSFKSEEGSSVSFPMANNGIEGYFCYVRQTWGSKQYSSRLIQCALWYKAHKIILYQELGQVLLLLLVPAQAH